MRSIRWEWLLVSGVMLVALGCAGSLYKKAMSQKDATVLRQYIQKYGEDDDPEMMQRARDAQVELDAVLYAEAEAIDQPESYRAYLAIGDISHLHKAKARKKHDDALLRNARAEKGFERLDAIKAEAFFPKETGNIAYKEGCTRRLEAIGGTLEGSAVAAFVQKCDVFDLLTPAMENAWGVFQFTTGELPYSHEAYLEWRGGDSDGRDSLVPDALRATAETWFLAQESQRLLQSEEDPTLIARVVSAESALPEMNAVKERHDALIDPCGVAKGWECDLASPESRDQWLQRSTVYLSACIVCTGKEAVTARLPELHKSVAKDKKAACKSEKKSGLKECKSGEAAELRRGCKDNFKGGKSGCSSEKRDCAEMKRMMNRSFGAGASRLGQSCGEGYSICMDGVKREKKQCSASVSAMEDSCKVEVEAEGIRCLALAESVGLEPEAAAAAAEEADRKARSHVCSKTRKREKGECKLQKKIASGECATAKKECKSSNRFANQFNDYSSDYRMSTSNCGSDARDCNASAKDAMKECMAGVDEQFEACVAGEGEGETEVEGTWRDPSNPGFR